MHLLHEIITDSYHSVPPTISSFPGRYLRRHLLGPFVFILVPTLQLDLVARGNSDLSSSLAVGSQGLGLPPHRLFPHHTLLASAGQPHWLGVLKWRGPTLLPTQDVCNPLCLWQGSLFHPPPFSFLLIILRSQLQCYFPKKLSLVSWASPDVLFIALIFTCIVPAQHLSQ